MNEITNTNFMTPTNLQEAIKIAEILAKSNFVPPAYHNKPCDILVSIQMGSEIGLPPIQSLQNIAVINGKPCIYGDALLALVKVHSEFEDIKEYTEDDDTVAVCEIKRKNQTKVISKFSLKDAEGAGLLKKTGVWQTYPKRMLQMRARGFALRDSFPDALHGLITREEAQDYPDEQNNNNFKQLNSNISDKSEQLSERISTNLDNNSTVSLPPSKITKQLPSNKEPKEEKLHSSTKTKDGAAENQEEIEEQTREMLLQEIGDWIKTDKHLLTKTYKYIETKFHKTTIIELSIMELKDLLKQIIAEANKKVECSETKPSEA